MINQHTNVIDMDRTDTGIKQNNTPSVQQQKMFWQVAQTSSRVLKFMFTVHTFLLKLKHLQINSPLYASATNHLQECIKLPVAYYLK
jgi:hypothetical protein